MGAYNIINASSLVAGLPEDVSQVLANFQAIATILNGGIDDSNINAAAAIAISKLKDYPTDATKFLRGDGTWVAPAPTGIAAVGNKISDLPAGTAGAQALLRLMPVTYNAGGATALPAATITAGDPSEFPTAGTFSTPNGDVAYTGKTGTTFTGCTGGIGTLAANAALVYKTGTLPNPLDLARVIYDATMGKWVTDQRNATAQILESVAGGVAYTTLFNALNPATIGSPVTQQWRKYDQAGLKFQARLDATMNPDRAVTVQFRTGFNSYPKDTAAAAATLLGFDANTTSRPIVFGAAGQAMIALPWGDAPAGATVADLIEPVVQWTAGPAGANVSGWGTYTTRWVS
jgi:hypothetical protein